LRIIGGKFKGLQLASVGKGDKVAHLRPTTDRVRESIFNLLINGGYGDPVSDARVLDLFSGTGALALEALSRGASHAVLVDDGAAAGRICARNIALCRAGAQTELLRRNATRLGDWQGDPFNLIFLDPPYGRDLGPLALASALEGGWIAEDAIILWEEGQEQFPPPRFERLDARRYGDTWVHILRPDG